jgi:hypothetical protein
MYLVLSPILVSLAGIIIMLGMKMDVALVMIVQILGGTKILSKMLYKIKKVNSFIIA